MSGHTLLRSDDAALHGAMATVTSEGRFQCMYQGGTRFGCTLCATRPMVKWSWHDHASSAAHASKITPAVATDAHISSEDEDPADALLREERLLNIPVYVDSD